MKTLNNTLSEKTAGNQMTINKCIFSSESLITVKFSNNFRKVYETLYAFTLGKNIGKVLRVSFFVEVLPMPDYAIVLCFRQV